MRRLLANPLAMVALSLGVALTVRAAGGDEPAVAEPIDCAAWVDHYVALTDAIPPYAAARAAVGEEQLAGARARTLAACEQVTGDPATYGDDLAVLTCTLGATDAAGWIACVDPRPPSRPAPDGEAAVLLSAIRVAERAYEAEWDAFLPCRPTPAEVPGATPVPFEGGGLEDFHILGWVPDGDVGCRYSVEVTDGGRDFRATAECDADGDGEIAVWTTTVHDRPAPTTAEEVR